MINNETVKNVLLRAWESNSISWWKFVRPEKAEQFYQCWISIVKDLIEEGYDTGEYEIFLDTVDKLQNFLNSRPEVISFRHPFTHNADPIVGIADMLSFFQKFEKCCEERGVK